MRKFIGLTLTALILSSCLTAEENTRAPVKNEDTTDGDDTGSRTGTGTGTNPCINCQEAADLLTSGLYRVAGSTPMSLNTEKTNYIKDTLPSGYYPSIEELPEVNYVDYSATYQVCGEKESYTNFAALKNSCITRNKDLSMWSATDNGIAGEADWELVYSKDGNFIWQDTRTELVWSYTLSSAVWSIASGVEDYDTTEQTSYCDELNKITFDKIKWRLPSREEFLQADIDGARTVLMDQDNNEVFWTATPGEETDESWGIRQSNGVLKSYNRDTPFAVRCVGIVIN